jgi:hypothetical protein
VDDYFFVLIVEKLRCFQSCPPCVYFPCNLTASRIHGFSIAPLLIYPQDCFFPDLAHSRRVRPLAAVLQLLIPFIMNVNAFSQMLQSTQYNRNNSIYQTRRNQSLNYSIFDFAVISWICKKYGVGRYVRIRKTTYADPLC